MRHAFLIMAHSNWKQLIILLSQIDAPGHDIYLHIDLKSENIPFDDFKTAVHFSSLFIFHKLKIYWGGYSQIETELFLFEAAAKGHYDYYHLL